jgi:hypothetical protein
MTHATDHLSAAYAMTVQQQGPTHYNIVTRPWAVYPSLRAAYENAARALWLVGAEPRRLRVERRLRLEHNDAVMADTAAQLLGHAGIEEKTLRQTVDPIARAAGVTLGRSRQWVKFEEMVRDGVGGVMGVDPKMAVVLWRCLSGLTHGDTWATLSILDRDEVAVSQDGQTITLMTSTNAATLATFMLLVLQSCEQATRWYDQQATKMFAP